MTSVGRAYSLENPNRFLEPVCKGYTYYWKVIAVGDSRVGKTSIINRFVHDEFPYTVICNLGVDFDTRILQVDGIPIKIQIWDTAGQERYNAVRASYYRGSKGILLVYDITQRSTYEHIDRWLKEIREHEYNHTEDAVIILVGNKTDLEQSRAVSTEEAQTFAEANNLLFIETSALSGSNIEAAYLNVLNEILQNERKNPSNEDQSSGTKLSTDNSKPSAYSCCGSS